MLIVSTSLSNFVSPKLCAKNDARFGLMSIFWTQKVKLFYTAFLANNSHSFGVI
jgi:hypothetical protein